MKALAIDFGTVNCTAHVVDDRECHPVPLDGVSLVMPSVVYQARRELAERQIPEREVERRLLEARNHEAREYRRRLRDAKLEARERVRQGKLKGKSLTMPSDPEIARTVSPMPKDTAMEKEVRAVLGREARQAGQRAYWDQSFFTAYGADEALIFGTAALNAYFEDPLSGLLVKSPKSMLGSPLGNSDYLRQFEGVIATMLTHIRVRAEAEAGVTLDRVMIGKPVRYHGGRNDEALSIMQQAAKGSGFQEVSFTYEPVAAAYEFERSLESDVIALIVDVGGGTTDCVVMQLGPRMAPRRNRDANILGVTGDRIGGIDFDEALSWRGFMDLLGKDTKTKFGLPLPHAWLINSIRVNDLPRQQAFLLADQEIATLAKVSAEPDKLRRFVALHKNRWQYRLVHEAEQSKIVLSQSPAHQADLNWLEPGLSVALSREQLEAATESLIEKIRHLALDAIKSAEVSPDVVFLTGGMAYMPAIRHAISTILGEDIPIRTGDMLCTVGRGLALATQKAILGV